jgi:hypothetical membrane protein
MPQLTSGPRSLSLPAWAGIAGPVLFTVAFLAQGAFRRGEYSAVAETISALEAGPGGWIQQLNFVVFGLLTMAYAVALHRGLPPSRAGIAGPALLFAAGIGLLLGAAFPVREDATGATYDPIGHTIGGGIFFIGSAVGLIVLSRRIARDPRWRNLAGYTLAVGALALVGVVLMRTLAYPENAVLHEQLGLAQRVLVLALLFPCQILLSIRLLQVGKDPS